MQLTEAIQSLESGKAKAVAPDPGQDLATVRAKLTYAARLAGVRFRNVLAEDRAVFTRGREGPGQAHRVNAGPRAGSQARGRDFGA